MACRCTSANRIRGARADHLPWSDPDFDPAVSAAYFVRVLEIPTPRWSIYDAVALGLPPSDLVPATIQERAWSAPLWYARVAGKPAGEVATAAAGVHGGHMPLVPKKTD